MAAFRVALDTHVLVSGLAYPASIPGHIVAEWRQGGLNVVLSRYILDMMVKVLPKLPRIKLNESEIRELADSFMFRADIVEPETRPEPTLRDEADQLVLGTLLASAANYLITGDKDLLALRDRYPIITPSEFWARHGG